MHIWSKSDLVWLLVHKWNIVSACLWWLQPSVQQHRWLTPAFSVIKQRSPLPPICSNHILAFITIRHGADAILGLSSGWQHRMCNQSHSEIYDGAEQAQMEPERAASSQARCASTHTHTSVAVSTGLTWRWGYQGNHLEIFFVCCYWKTVTPHHAGSDTLHKNSHRLGL